MTKTKLWYEKLVFCRVVREGSIARAAQSLGTQEETVSSALGRLENALGERLLIRSARGSRPTASGWNAHQLWRRASEDLLRLADGVREAQSAPLRVAYPSTTGASLLAPLTAACAAANPDLRFDVELTQGSFHPLWNGLDLRVVHGRYTLEPCRQLRLARLRRILVASPRLLADRDLPKTPNDLRAFDVVGDRDGTEAGAFRLFAGDETATVAAAPRVRLRNHFAAMRAALLAPVVAAAVPEYLAAPHIRSGELVRVLPDWESPPLPLRVVLPEGRIPAGILKLLQQFLSHFERSGEAETDARSILTSWEMEHEQTARNGS